MICVCLSAECGGEIMLDSNKMFDLVESPGFRDSIPYSEGVQCNWLVKVFILWIHLDHSAM